METLPLMRLASGSDLNLHVERGWMETVFRMQGPDGLLYYPKDGRPWCRVSCFGPEPLGEHYFSLGISGRMLNAMTIQYRLTNNPVWRDAGRRFVDGIRELAIHPGDYATSGWIRYGPGGAIPPGIDPRYTPGYSMANWIASTIAGLIHDISALTLSSLSVWSLLRLRAR